MAEHPHAALVRRGYEAFVSGDMEAMVGLLAADVTHHVPGGNPLSGDHKGRDAVLDLYRRLGEETGGTMRAELQRVLVDGRGHAVSVHRWTATRKGRALDSTGVLVFRILGDRITDIDECVEDMDVEDAFWS
ncbi:nuclear transport factor 2 family protein [Kitasatospora sp. NBC_01539]|uniref:nuclear transport factor 2 family protein n=1 Tax=Kitasatospora sp. NBC_01539 TaxID=2903577 RepID=UPI0038601C3E